MEMARFEANRRNRLLEEPEARLLRECSRHRPGCGTPVECAGSSSLQIKLRTVAMEADTSNLILITPSQAQDLTRISG